MRIGIETVLMEKVWDLQTLYDTMCAEIPDQSGIYVVFAPREMEIHFRSTIDNTHALFYKVDILRKKFETCKNKTILYIGKASGKRGLRQRLRQYMMYGWNQASNHKGGRAIWQIENVEKLLLTYEICEEADEREHQLLKAFQSENGTLPLANWRT